MYFPLLIVLVAALVAGLAGAYRFLFQPLICDHFGEEYPSRGRRAASVRRRIFETRCLKAMGCVMAASGLSGMRDLELPVLPDAATWGTIGLLIFAALWAMAALSRWRSPFEN
jgi:hypothetical protein